MLKTLLKVQFAALKASLFRSRRKQSKGGTGRTIGFALLFLYVIVCFSSCSAACFPPCVCRCTKSNWTGSILPSPA